jgi:tetratricopeptide (TPR) repeat protein
MQKQKVIKMAKLSVRVLFYSSTLLLLISVLVGEIWPENFNEAVFSSAITENGNTKYVNDLDYKIHDHVSGKAEYLYTKGDYTEALTGIDNAIRINGGHKEDYELKVDILTKMGELKKAEELQAVLEEFEK